MTPAQRRTVVTEACTRRDLPVRRACRYLGIHRAVIRYVSRRTEPVDLVARLHDAATAKPRWGSPRLTWQLRREGWTVNHQRIERLVRVEDLRVGSHRRRKRTAQRRGPRPVPTRPDERWSMDLLTDTLAEGRPFRVGTLVDDATRECPVLLVDRSVPARRVIDGLEMALLLRGRPQAIEDNYPGREVPQVRSLRRQKGPAEEDAVEREAIHESVGWVLRAPRLGRFHEQTYLIKDVQRRQRRRNHERVFPVSLDCSVTHGLDSSAMDLGRRPHSLTRDSQQHAAKHQLVQRE